jgi:hypothetical protein
MFHPRSRPHGSHHRVESGPGWMTWRSRKGRVDDVVAMVNVARKCRSWALLTSRNCCLWQSLCRRREGKCGPSSAAHKRFAPLPITTYRPLPTFEDCETVPPTPRHYPRFSTKSYIKKCFSQKLPQPRHLRSGDGRIGLELGNRCFRARSILEGPRFR